MNKYKKAWLTVSALAHASSNFKCYQDEMDIQLIQELAEKAIPCKFVKSYSQYGTETCKCPDTKKILEWLESEYIEKSYDQ